MSESYASQDKTVNIEAANDRLRQRSAEKCFPIKSQKGPCNKDDIGISANSPECQPCIEIRWGDSHRDQMETDDLEILCLVASNPYSNLTLKDVTIIQIDIQMDNREVAKLPDGQRSVTITPSEMISFGDLPPCSGNTATEVAREVVMVNKGAVQGDYKMKLTYCFSTEFALSDSDYFPITLVRS